MSVLMALHVCAVFAATETADADPRGAGVEGKDFATFGVSRLQCVIGNNKSKGEHVPGYNGVFSLTSPDQEQTAYVPLYAGLNLENFFDARPRHKDAKVFFEPRYAPMDFRRVSETVADLIQPATPEYAVDSSTRFELREPYYIDMTFRCRPRKAVFEGGFMGIFWASYINEPLNKSIYFLTPGSTLDKPKWFQFCTQGHDHYSTVKSESDKFDAPFQEVRTLLWNQISPLRFSEAFYYGQVRNMVIIYIFEPNPYLRFAHSPSGGGSTEDGADTNPAWDFQLVIPNYQVDKEYGFRMRVVYKPWVDRADVIAEVRKYREFGADFQTGVGPM